MVISNIQCTQFLTRLVSNRKLVHEAANGTEFKEEKTNRLRKQIPPVKERERKKL
jgi:hypothetical protein